MSKIPVLDKRDFFAKSKNKLDGINEVKKIERKFGTIQKIVEKQKNVNHLLGKSEQNIEKRKNRDLDATKDKIMEGDKNILKSNRLLAVKDAIKENFGSDRDFEKKFIKVSFATKK